MRTKKKRYNFQFDEKTNELLEMIALKTGLKYCTIVKRGISKFAEEEGYSLE